MDCVQAVLSIDCAMVAYKNQERDRLQDIHAALQSESIILKRRSQIKLKCTAIIQKTDNIERQSNW